MSNKPSQLDGPRRARQDEREDLLAMIDYIFRTSVGRPPSIGRDWAHVYAPDNLVNVAVIGDPVADKLIASTGVWASDVVTGDAQVRVGGINTVGTLPEYRERGLGSQVVLAAHQIMRDLGCQLGLLSTGIADWYRRMGWEEAGEERSYQMDQAALAQLPQLDAGEQRRVLAWPSAEAESVLADVLTSYHAAQMGARRTLDGLRGRLTARRIQQIVVAERDGRLVAYLFVLDNEVLEWAGPAATVAGLVRAYYAGVTSGTVAPTGDGTTQPALFTPGGPHPLVARLDEAGIPYTSSHLGMLYLIEPQAILETYGVTAVEIDPVAEETFTLRSTQPGDTRSVTLDRKALTQLFFGPVDAGADASTAHDLFPDLFPLPFWQWYLEMV